MNMLLSLITTVCATMNRSLNSSCLSECPAYIENLDYVLNTDILCCNKINKSELPTIFGYIPVTTNSISDSLLASKMSKEKEIFTRSTKFSYDSHFLYVAIEKFRKSKEIEILAYEMILRLIASYIEHSTYPKDCVKLFEAVKCSNLDLKDNAYTTFCKLLKKRITRTPTLMVLNDLLGFFFEHSGDKEDSQSKNVQLSTCYSAYFLQIIDHMINKIEGITEIQNTEDRKVVVKNYILLPNNYTNKTGDLVIDAKPFVDTEALY
ncbi:Spore wall protein 30 [Nosema granulosis]|uniref:Spore wall protein 30 n=1 Tax=Nosema granulosis TaxID=83296 RepID=A0A9P6H2P5_9MICR|nr:Spore wall protein 30 [Nosema granulosis]